MISLLAMIFVSFLIIPELIHSWKGVRKKFQGPFYISITDYLLKYFNLVLMFIPLGINEFGFRSIIEMIIYVLGNFILCLVYDVKFIFNVRDDSYSKDITLTRIFVIILLISGFILRHYLLIISSILYYLIHCRIMKENKDQYLSK